jgi:hypothetical protein
MLRFGNFARSEPGDVWSIFGKLWKLPLLKHLNLITEEDVPHFKGLGLRQAFSSASCPVALSTI